MKNRSQIAQSCFSGSAKLVDLSPPVAWLGILQVIHLILVIYHTAALVLAVNFIGLHFATFLSLCVFLQLKYSSKYFEQFESPVWSRRHVGVHPRYIWNLLWLSGRLIISTEQTSIYISTFHNTLTFKWAKNH